MTERKDGARFCIAAIETRQAMREHARPPSPSGEVKAAAAAIVSARMTDAGVQPRTVAATGARAEVVTHRAIEVDSKGRVEVHVSEVTALFNPNACAVMRLASDGLVDYPQVKAALRFAWAGDRVMGAARIRTVDLNRVSGLAIDGLSAAEIDAEARGDWNVAMVLLMRAEFRILDGVMRRDESAHAAAAAAYPKYSDRKKLTGMGDQALISATDKLAMEYGYKAHNEPVAGGMRLR